MNLGKNFKKIGHLKIRTKIMLLYTALLFFSLGISMIIYTNISSNYAIRTLNELTIQNIESKNGSLELLINDISDYTKQLISNQNTQTILSDASNNKLELNRLDREIAASVIFNHKVSSAYIYDFEGQQYYRDKRRYKGLVLSDFESQPWYKAVLDLKGGYYVSINAGGMINDADTDYLTMMRVINSNNDHQPIGFLMVNVEVETIMEALNLSEDAGFYLQMYTNPNAEGMVIGSLPDEAYEGFYGMKNTQGANLGDATYEGIRYRASGIVNENYGWRMVYLEEDLDRSDMIANFNFVFLLIIGVIGLTIFYGSVYISRYISDPIVKLTKIMKAVENEQFEELKLGTRKDEIGSLIKGYNYMIIRIKGLINKIISEQETIKQAELRILMEQIKPHFIYNTLDSISALVLRGKNDEAYNSLTALGRFYRASLSDGNFVIDLHTEIEIIKNYLYIQNIRYTDLFEVTYQLDESLKAMRVPKLILQPLVENSLYHGIRPIGMDGEIQITTAQDQDYVYLSVKDNGCGMSEDKINQIMAEAHSESEDDKKSSVGLPATIRRVRNMYGPLSSVNIISNQYGTEIKISIKKEQSNGQ